MNTVFEELKSVVKIYSRFPYLFDPIKEELIALDRKFPTLSSEINAITQMIPEPKLPVL